MVTATYTKRRGELETYFDRTAVDAWAKLTSDAPVSGIRATVRAGRDAMRARLLSWLPEDLTGRRILDAGCGTGALAIEAARRGADVVAIDISSTLVGLAQTRTPEGLRGSLTFMVGDMQNPALGSFDHVVAMDSLIHYNTTDIARVMADMATRTRHSMLITVAPRTPLLMAFWVLGRAFPRKDRAPAIIPVSASGLKTAMAAQPDLAGWGIADTHRVATSFYISAALKVDQSGGMAA